MDRRAENRRLHARVNQLPCVVMQLLQSTSYQHKPIFRSKHS